MASSQRQGIKRPFKEECSSGDRSAPLAKRRQSLAVEKDTKQTFLTCAEQIMSQVKKKLKTDLSDKDADFLKYVRTMISNLITSSKIKTKVGVFGKSGVGKSSLINTVLGVQELLPSSTITACTSVVIQVEANTTDSEYKAKIEFIPKKEWEEELQHFEKIRSKQFEEEGYDTCFAKINAVYGKAGDFASIEQLMNPKRFRNIQEFLTGTQKTISCHSASDLSAKISCFTRAQSGSSTGPFYWPLVKRVTIEVPKCRGILENVILMDLPGTGDYNRSRDEMWKQCLSECSTVWIVADINRAAGSKEPWQILNSSIKDITHGGECNSITFICTKTDIINPNVYAREHKMKNEDLRIQVAQKSNGREYSGALTRTCILHRNEEAKAAVKAMFARQTELQKHFTCDEKFFKVFTVSSQEFCQESGPSVLHPEDTEIPKLRKLLEHLNHNLHETSVEDYIQGAHGILSLIHSANSHTKDKLDVKHKAHRKLRQKLHKKVDLLKDKFNKKHEELDQCLSKGVKDSEDFCMKTADKEVIQPEDKTPQAYHQTLRALCKNYGFIHSTNGDVRNLNESLASHMYEHIDRIFKQLWPLNVSGEDGKSDESIGGMIHRFTIITNSTEEEFKDLPLNLTFIVAQERKLKARLKKEIIRRKKKIYNSISESIKSAMSTVYPEASSIIGKESFKRMQAVLRHQIELSKKTMFRMAKKLVLTLFKNLTDYILETLRDEMDDIIKHALIHENVLPLPDVSNELKDLKFLTSELEYLNSGRAKDEQRLMDDLHKLKEMISHYSKLGNMKPTKPSNEQRSRYHDKITLEEVIEEVIAKAQVNVSPKPNAHGNDEIMKSAPKIATRISREQPKAELNKLHLEKQISKCDLEMDNLNLQMKKTHLEMTLLRLRIKEMEKKGL